ncbi:MAG: long-chain fatty acid--CoA ligase [Spirochaetes bacterium]|nr:long-chain fatty acid--CoA ligase [Spirochaetota bacterium]
MFQETSMAAVFQNQAVRLGEKACVSYKMDGKYGDISWNEMNDMIRSLGSYLIDLGVKKGDAVALFSQNRYEWWVADQAILSIGAVNVPIYATNSAEEARYVLDHSGSVLCFTGTKEHYEKVTSVRGGLPCLNGIVSFDAVDGALTLRDACQKGEESGNREEFDRRLSGIREEDPATIIYTSGTTGNPKGVMLSHGNFLANVRQGIEDFLTKIEYDSEVYLSMLPLSHALERTCGYYMPVRIGGRVAFAVDFSTVAQNLGEVRPTIFYSVPRLFEKIRAGIVSMTGGLKGSKKRAFDFALAAARKNLPYVCAEKKPWGLTALRVRLAEKLVYSKLKKLLGLDRLKFCISGGGPLSPVDAEFFIGMGITIYEGYGLTETSPVTNVNRPGEIKPGSVGRALPETIVRLSDEGEVQVKGPQVMMGYYKNDEATKEVFTADGFFRTGDIGVFDEKGRLTITGRIKDIIVTSGGKNISPQNIENHILTSPLVEQMAVIGDNRPYLAALIVPSFDALKRWAKDNGVAFNGVGELIAHPKVNDLYRALIDDHMKDYARVEQIRAFRLMETEWTQATDELTPTLKVKRKAIEKKYAGVIDEMYREN